MADFLQEEPFELFLVEEGDGFGVGGFGGLDEPFGSTGIDVFIPQFRDILFPPARRGAVILAGGTDGRESMVNVTIDSGLVNLGRTSHIDSCGITCASTRNLIFEQEFPPPEAANFVTSSFYYWGISSTNHTVQNPVGVEAGDLVINVFFNSNVGLAVQPGGYPGTFSESLHVTGTISGNNRRWQVSSMIATASLPPTWIWTTNSGVATGYAAFFVYKSASLLQFDAINSGQGLTDSLTHTAVDVTSSFDASTILALYLLGDTTWSGPDPYPTVDIPPPGMTSRSNETFRYPANPDESLSAYDEEQVTAGPYAGKEITTNNANSDCFSIVIAIRSVDS